MGITNWIYGNSTKGEEEEIPLIDSEARTEGNGKVKRRRHQVATRGGLSLILRMRN
jgi:hypothetical protein